MMKGPGIFDFGSAKAPPGDANTWLDKIFQLENYTTKLNIAAQLHQAANHGTGSPSVFVAKTLIKDSEDFKQKIPDILQCFAELVSALSGNELTFQTLVVQMCAATLVSSRLTAGSERSVQLFLFHGLAGPCSFFVTLKAMRPISQPTAWCFNSTLRPIGQPGTSIAHRFR